MDHTTPNKDEIKLLIDNALLQNNERTNKSIEAMGDKVTNAVTVTTQTFLTELTKVVEKQGAMRVEIDTLKGKVNNIWGKFIGIGTALTTITALITYLMVKK